LPISLRGYNLIATAETGSGKTMCFAVAALAAVNTSLRKTQVCVAVCCGVLRCVAVCCSVLTWRHLPLSTPLSAKRRYVLRCVAVCCGVLRLQCVHMATLAAVNTSLRKTQVCVAVCCGVLRCDAVCSRGGACRCQHLSPQNAGVWCGVLRCAAMWCGMVRCVAG